MDLLCRRQVEGSCQQVWALQAVASQCSPPEYHRQKYQISSEISNIIGNINQSTNSCLRLTVQELLLLGGSR